MIRASLVATVLFASQAALAEPLVPHGTSGPITAEPAPPRAKNSPPAEPAKEARKQAALPGMTNKAEPKSPVQPASVNALAGRWTGQGMLTLARGEPIPFRCTMTYRPNGGSGEIKQALRCRSGENRIDTATILSINGSDVSGRWQDNIYSLNGTLRGTTTGDRLHVKIEGQFFEAQMLIETQGCAQTVRVVPRDTSAVREIAADLRRC